MDTKISQELYSQAVEIMPAGVNSPVRACRNVGVTPLFVKNAKGDRIFDEDGNSFIDYICSWGPNIFGHGFEPVIQAVKNAAETGLTYGACHKGEIELGKIIRRNFPSMEMLRLVNSGTEAVMSAVRAARGFTGRDKIVKFQGCYHGHSDGMLVKAGSGMLTAGTPDSAGVPKGFAENTLVAEYNNPASVEKLFAENKDEIAAVIVEPVAANMGVVPPENGFLQALRDITQKHNALLIFDEVITGFRLSLGGAQKFFGIKPDLTCLGKIVGGGMPLAAYGGRKEIMEVVAPLGSVYQAGTLSGNPVATAAGIAQLTALENDETIYDRLEEKSAKIEKVAKSVGLNVNRVGSLMTFFFTDKKVKDFSGADSCDREAYGKFYRFMLEKGINLAPSQFEAMFVSDAHTDEDIEYTCNCIEEFVKI